jgi:hypothetical protein
MVQGDGLKINRMRSARALAAACSVAMMFVAGGCASAQAGGGREAMPAELVGVWDIAASGCTGQGNPDSDTRLVITPTGIDNYEQTFKPINASSVSKSPRAWNIRSTLTFDGESSGYRALYALDGGGRLTIVDEQRTETYSRCK